MELTIQRHQVVEPQSGMECQVAVHTLGNSDHPPVICVHGLTRNAKDFYPLAEALTDDFYVVMPDVPGRGESPNLPDSALYNNAFYASIIAELLDKQNLNRLRWIGTSMGGLIGMILAATRKDLIHSMLLNDVGNIIPVIALQNIKEYVGVNTESDSYDVLVAQVTQNLATFGIRDKVILDHFVTSSIIKTDSSYRLNYDADIRLPFAELANEDADLTKLWSVIECPILIFRGEYSNLLPKQVALDMVGSKDNVELFEVANAGHAPSLTSEREVNRIKDWLR